MKKFLLITFLACFWIIFPVMAQQTPEPTPIFPPNPEDIFADGVNWALVENQPVTSSSGIIPSNCVNTFPQNDNMSGFWQWHIVYDPEIEKQVVCFDDTLATYDILPENYFEWEVYGNPNNEWLILIGREEGGAYAYQIFSHHLSTGQQNFLGKKEINADTSVWVDGWLNDTLGVMGNSIYNHKTPFMTYYRFDVEVPNSLEFVLSGGYASRNIIKIDAPSRYVAFYSGGYDDYQEEHFTCSMVILDATGIYRHELGYECLTTFFVEGEEKFPFYRFDNSVIYYITISQENDALAELHRYDAHYLPNELEESPFPLFLGEFERVLSVSPDEQYIVLQMSDDGVIDSTDIGWGCCSELKWRHSIGIIKVGDASDYKFTHWIYQSDPLVTPFLSQLAWLDERTFAILSLNTEDSMLVNREGDSIINFLPSSLRRIEITDMSINTTITTRFQLSSYHVSINDSLFNLSPDNLYWLHNNKVVNLRTFDELTILKEDVYNQYSIRMGWLYADEHTLRVVICQKECDWGNEITYHITLP